MEVEFRRVYRVSTGYAAARYHIGPVKWVMWFGATSWLPNRFRTPPIRYRVVVRAQVGYLAGGSHRQASNMGESRLSCGTDDDSPV